jgi:hypothetical protein
MIKSLSVAGIAAVALVVSAPAAVAEYDRDCSDFASSVVIVNGYDPLNLDADNDGVGCEGNPGEPVTTDLYADLRGDDQLADTGAGDLIQRHPLRAYGAAGLTILAGALTVTVVRRRARTEGN